MHRYIRETTYGMVISLYKFSSPSLVQVFETLVSKMTRSQDSVVRAACSSAFGLLLRSSKSTLWRGARLDRTDSGKKANDSESVKK